MTNKERQEKLNVEKWKASKVAMEDLSGKMIWCQLCQKCENDTYADFICGYHKVCLAEQSERDKLCLCAFAYNKYKRKINDI